MLELVLELVLEPEPEPELEPVQAQVRAVEREHEQERAVEREQELELDLEPVRFVEEALELAQAIGVSREKLHLLVDYVVNRPVGEVHQEVGGAMLTLYALAESSGVDADAQALSEVERVETPEIRDKVRRRQAEKREALDGDVAAHYDERARTKREELEAELERTRSERARAIRWLEDDQRKLKTLRRKVRNLKRARTVDKIRRKGLRQHYARYARAADSFDDKAVEFALNPSACMVYRECAAVLRTPEEQAVAEPKLVRRLHDRYRELGATTKKESLRPWSSRML